MMIDRATGFFITKKNVYSSPVSFFSSIVGLKLIATLFAIYIYARVSPFTDAEHYLHSGVGWNFSLIFQRTLFTSFVYSSLKSLLFYDPLVHLFISALFAGTLVYVFKLDYYFLDKPLFISSLLLPHFLIWSGVVGKEVLAIIGFFLVIKACVDLIIWNKVRVITLIIGFFLAAIVRPHYAVSYFYLFCISLLFAKSKIKGLGLFSPSKSFLLFLLVSSYCLILLFYLEKFYVDYLMNYMHLTQQYFLRFVNSTGNRWDINWEYPSDFIVNLPWGLPFSIIGPTWAEALQRPFLFPVFIEGCLAWFLLFLITCQLIRFVKLNPKYSSLIIWGFIPAVIVGLIINYPFGIFNPGSAVRYKQALSPLLYFYPLLLMASVKRKKYLDIQVSAIKGNCSSHHTEWNERSPELKHSATPGVPSSQATQDDV